MFLTWNPKVSIVKSIGSWLTNAFASTSPYLLQWVNHETSIEISNQALICFSFGSYYEDKVLCDVLPMEACEILLGRPWMYDRRVQHDGYGNT